MKPVLQQESGSADRIGMLSVPSFKLEQLCDQLPLEFETEAKHIDERDDDTALKACPIA